MKIQTVSKFNVLMCCIQVNEHENCVNEPQRHGNAQDWNPEFKGPPHGPPSEPVERITHHQPREDLDGGDPQAERQGHWGPHRRT